MTIPLLGDMGVIEVPIFSYPEFSIERNQVEFVTLDYTHILTNIHGHILKNGYDFCKWEHYRELADNRPDLLSYFCLRCHRPTECCYGHQNV